MGKQGCLDLQQLLQFSHTPVSNRVSKMDKKDSMQIRKTNMLFTSAEFMFLN